MKKLLVRLAISIVIGGVLLYLASRNLSLEGTWEALLAAKWWVLGPYVAVMAVQHVFRVWRWGFLLAPIGHVPFGRLLPISSVGFFAILGLPLRMGEFVRPFLIADPPRIRMSHGLGTMAVERVFDGLVLALTAFVAVALAKRDPLIEVPPWVQGTGIVALAVFFIALVVLGMTLWQRERAVTICERVVRVISPRLAVRAASIARGIVDGFQVLPDWRRLLPFIGATLCYWMGNAVAVWVLGLGFDLGLTLGGSMAFVGLIGIGIMIPAGPGFIGNYELFAEAALRLYARPHAATARGAAFVIGSHAVNAMWYIAAGLLSLMSPHVRFKGKRSSSLGEGLPLGEPQEQGGER